MNHAGGMIGNLQKPRALRADETLADRMRSVGNNRRQQAIAIALDQDSAVRLADSAERPSNVAGSRHRAPREARGRGTCRAGRRDARIASDMPNEARQAWVMLWGLPANGRLLLVHRIKNARSRRMSQRDTLHTLRESEVVSAWALTSSDLG
jgi:hypothetical protein